MRNWHSFGTTLAYHAHRTLRRGQGPVGRAARVAIIIAPLMVALALGWRTPTALAAPGAASNAGVAPGTQATVVNTETLHLRSGAGLNCPIIESMPDGATVTVVAGPTSADGYDWYQVTYNGKTGYAVAPYLAFATPSDGLEVGGYASVTAPYLNMRCGPSINCPISMSLPHGATVKLLDGPSLSDNYHWWKVSYTGQSGYVAGEYLRAANGPDDSHQGCASTCSLVVGGDAQVTSATLNLRTGASVSCPVITSMPRGATVKVLSSSTSADGYDWYKVSYGGTVGYAAGAYLKPVSGTGGNGCLTNCGSPHVGEDAYVRDTPILHLRSGAGLSCDVLATMPEGTKVHVMDGPTSADGYDWYHVSYKNQDGHDWDGYVAGNWLGSAN